MIHEILSKYPIYWRYAPYIYRSLGSYDIDRYPFPPDPFKIFWINPKDIIEMTRRPLPPKKKFGAVQSGEWDIRSDLVIDSTEREWYYQLIHGIKFHDTLFYKAFESRFLKEASWSDTLFYQKILAGLESGQYPWKWPENQSELDKWGKETDELYYAIKNEGYKTQRQLNPTQGFLETRKDEIMVDIGRDGKVLLVDCRHRLAIAQILDLNQVPVVVSTRHDQWMKQRNESD